ncbi:hypothetical protein VitviT2T_008656 [Vitis vinifera]|uniref:Uncharacterized protein n=1 Tax=Vitis vinifera TaxID=29760 RepID=A0ABY9C5K8_VITVI|nr:hypothetical protein VitviT2T_008656 [Vitis vinifera]
MGEAFGRQMGQVCKQDGLLRKTETEKRQEGGKGGEVFFLQAGGSRAGFAESIRVRGYSIANAGAGWWLVLAGAGAGAGWCWCWLLAGAGRWLVLAGVAAAAAGRW